MASLGTDISGVDDLDPALSVVGGRRALAEAVARRLGTPAGTNQDDPSYGFDLTDAVGSSMPPDEIEQQALAQARLEEEVEEARANTVVTGSLDAQVVEMTITLIDAQGPFAFTLRVDADLTMSLLLGTI
jgi:hypothetical protein